MYEILYNYVKRKYKEKQNYVMQIQTAFQYTKKQNTFTQTMQKMLKQDLILQIMNLTDRYQRKTAKK